MDAFIEAKNYLEKSDETPLPQSLGDHALTGDKDGYRSLHINSKKNPKKNTWVLMYIACEKTITLIRTGTHDDVYGK